MSGQKRVADRLNSAQLVIKAARTHRALLTESLQTRLGQPALDTGVLIDAIAGAIEGDAQALEAAMQAHRDELDDDGAVREARDAQAQSVYEQLIELRSLLDGVYGRPALVALGQTGALTRRPDRLLIEADTVVRKAEQILPGLEGRLGSQVDPARIVAPLQAAAEGLRQALDAVRQELREADATLLARNAAMEKYDATFSRGATALSALFRLADLDEYARRVRPSGRRPGRTADADDVADPEETLDFDPDATVEFTPRD